MTLLVPLLASHLREQLPVSVEGSALDLDQRAGWYETVLLSSRRFPVEAMSSDDPLSGRFTQTQSPVCTGGSSLTWFVLLSYFFRGSLHFCTSFCSFVSLSGLSAAAKGGWSVFSGTLEVLLSASENSLGKKVLFLWIFKLGYPHVPFKLTSVFFWCLTAVT